MISGTPCTEALLLFWHSKMSWRFTKIQINAIKKKKREKTKHCALDENASSLEKVLPYIVCLHKNRAHQLQQGLNWQISQLQVSLTLHSPARGKQVYSSSIVGRRMYMTENEKKQKVDILFRPVVGDAPVQGDAVTELSVVAVLLVLPLGIMAVFSQSGSSSPLAKASRSLN